MGSESSPSIGTVSTRSELGCCCFVGAPGGAKLGCDFSGSKKNPDFFSIFKSPAFFTTSGRRMKTSRESSQARRDLHRLFDTSISVPWFWHYPLFEGGCPPVQTLMSTSLSPPCCRITCRLQTPMRAASNGGLLGRRSPQFSFFLIILKSVGSSSEFRT